MDYNHKIIFCPLCKEELAINHFIRDEPVLTCGHQITADLRIECRAKEVQARIHRYMEEGYNFSEAVDKMVEEAEWHPYETR